MLGFRQRDHPHCLQSFLSTLDLSCKRLLPLRHRTKNRYRWVVSPYPTGTPPRKIRQALLGAITPSLSRAGTA